MGRKSREKANRTGPSAGNLRRQEARGRLVREAVDRARKAAEERRADDERMLQMSGRGHCCKALHPWCTSVRAEPLSICRGTWGRRECTSPLTHQPPPQPDDPPEFQQRPLRLQRRPLGIAGLLAVAALGAAEMNGGRKW